MWTEQDVEGIIREQHFARNVRVYQDRPSTISEMLTKTVNVYPNHEAIVMGHTRLT